MKNLTKRQSLILEYIQKHPDVSNLQIKEHLARTDEPISRITITRDLQDLLELNLIEAQGQGRNVRYHEKVPSPALKFIDPESYFQLGPDERSIASDHFNWSIFAYLANIFTDNELKDLDNWNQSYRNRVKKLSDSQIKKEFERLTIELSWKSSQIEGNTYSLIDTEILIKEQKEAEGHQKEEAMMILNHKKVLDFIWQKDDYFKILNLQKVENIHSLIVDGLNVKKGLRASLVGIVGTRFKPIDNAHQIKEALTKTINLINQSPDPFTKSLVAILMIAYLQPFEDGNKRTSRLLGNALLLAHDACPLSYRSINEADYKKALVLFYEQNNLRMFKELFIEQFKFAVDNYFQISQ